MLAQVKINDKNCFAFTSKEKFLNYIIDKNKILVALNAEKIIKDEPRLKMIINNNIGYPDGIGVVMALRQKGLDAIKIPGAEFWLDIVKALYKEKKSFYILGATQDVVNKTVQKLKADFPDINIVGYQNGYLNEKSRGKLENILIEKKPNVVFVAQGSPRQEYLMEELNRIHPALYMGLGGSFDVYTGLKKRAPILFLKLNLEWFYRLIKEPTRLGRQLVLVKFFVKLLLKKL